MKYIVLALVLFLGGCGECENLPAYDFQEGDITTHQRTNEKVRIVTKWSLVALRCDRERYGEYTIRFPDGAEIGPVSWEELREITP